MICKHCGFEIITDNAVFCNNCLKPLENETEDISSESEQVFLNLDRDASEPDLSAEIDDDNLDVADPIDFIISQNDFGRQESAENEDSPDRGTDQIITVERNKNLDFGMIELEAGLGSSLAVETAVSTTKKESEAINPAQPEQSGSRGFADNKITVDSRGEENVTATRKIITAETSEELPPPLGIGKQTVEKGPSLDLPKVARSKGVILLSGETLYLTGGTKVFPGDQILIGERVFDVRPKLKNKTRLIGITSGGAAVFLAIMLYLGGFISFGSGRLVGMAISSNGYPLSAQVIRVAEANKTVATDQAGFFLFEGLKSGLYTVQLLRDGTAIAEERIAIIDKEITTMTLYESGSEKPTSGATPKASEKSGEARKSQKAETELGTLKISSKPTDATAYLDDKPLGAGAGNYSIKPGKYVLSVKKSGYDTQYRDITIKSGKTQSYEFALLKAKKSDKKTNGELAYENEAAGNYHEAMRYYDKILEKSPKDVGAISGKARCYRAQGLTDKAVTYYTQAAVVAGAKGDIAGQIDALSSIVEIRPNTITAYSSRADIYFTQGEYARAASDYQTIVQLDRRNLGVLYKLGHSYYYAHDYNNALSAYKAAEELNFADPKAHVCQAKTYLMMGDQKNMRKSYERCKEFTTYAARLEFSKDPDWQKVLDALGVDE